LFFRTKILERTYFFSTPIEASPPLDYNYHPYIYEVSQRGEDYQGEGRQARSATYFLEQSSRQEGGVPCWLRTFLGIIPIFLGAFSISE